MRKVGAEGSFWFSKFSYSDLNVTFVAAVSLFVLALGIKLSEKQGFRPLMI